MYHILPMKEMRQLKIMIVITHYFLFCVYTLCLKITKLVLISSTGIAQRHFYQPNPIKCIKTSKSSLFGINQPQMGNSLKSAMQSNKHNFHEPYQ